MKIRKVEDKFHGNFWEVTKIVDGKEIRAIGLTLELAEKNLDLILKFRK